MRKEEKETIAKVGHRVREKRQGERRISRCLCTYGMEGDGGGLRGSQRGIENGSEGARISEWTKLKGDQSDGESRKVK